MATPSPPEIRAARSYLRTKAHARTSDINPRHFAAAAKEQNVGFDSLMKFISQIYAGGSDQENYRVQQLNQSIETGS